MDSGLQGSSGNLHDSLHSELELILQQQQRNRHILSRERDLNMYRSGSAPPTVDGSLSAMGSLFMNSDYRDIGSSRTGILSEDELRSHPEYLKYYYSHEYINPRLPPPLLSKEDWRVAQRFQAGGSSFGGVGDQRKKLVQGDNSSLFSLQPGISAQQAENDLMKLRNASSGNPSRNMSGEWVDRDSDGLIGIGQRRKSFADILQDGIDQSASVAGHLSGSASCNTFYDMADATGISNMHPSLLARSKTPDSYLRSSGCGLPPRVVPIEKMNAVDPNLHTGHSSTEVVAALSKLTLSNSRHADEETRVNSHHLSAVDNLPNGFKHNYQQQILDNSNAENPSLPGNYGGLVRKNGMVENLNGLDGLVNIPKRTNSSANLNASMDSSGFGNLEVPSFSNHNADISGLDFTPHPHLHDAYSANQKLNPASLASTADGGRASMSRLVNQVSPDLHSPLTDPSYIQYLQRTYNLAAQQGTASPNDPSLYVNYLSPAHGDLNGPQKAYIAALLAQRKQQYDLSLLGKLGGLNHGYHGVPSYDRSLSYPSNSMGNALYSSSGHRNFQNPQRMSRSTSMTRDPMGEPLGPWYSDMGSVMEGRYMPTLLEELKNNKTTPFDLSDIVGHVVEFSTDQFGSRFIQQKLETATEEEKNKIFPDISPYARILMTDVFGNYVIQKFFEHGTESQRRELASHITGHVLPLSLQMYGCRVIQKALEVVDLDQQKQMVIELDGSIMKCVLDQNGNHVIQKCIECIPQVHIHFIISSFFGQVVQLSTHPYGCRVIQRVLEHCDDSNTQQTIMEEIMQSVCILAQDQYGNYVIQHVLEHGKPHERSTIIRQLAGQIVKMSQQKFASNVVEKCLKFGAAEERQLLVNEMLGSNDDNEPLQAMMKDPFGNYVVQKVLETCDDKSLELILSRIKVHLNALKRYTFGKHIVSRVEKLIATGERRIGLSSSRALLEASQ